MPALPRDLPAWTLAAAALRAGRPAALLCVVRSEGSSPGRQGFKMTVTAEAVAGSIGGGIMEHKWVELARQRLREGSCAPLLRPQIHRREAPADRSGMMCAGEQEVLLWPLQLLDLPVVAAIAEALQTLDGGGWEVSAAGGLRLAGEAPAGFYDYQPGAAWHYREQLGFRDQLTIVGGGHVSLALSQLASSLEFEITVLDDRADLPTLAANHFAHYRHCIAGYEALAVAPGARRYVVVMTVGYRTDAVALRQLLGHRYAYLGVLGSATKVAELRRTLAEEGFAATDLARLRGPAGVSVNSRTPEEIAVSIAAELIAVRNAPAG
jgi:xanthine dehydrogenase accessory factor